jgi:hypothetical protein
MPAARNARVARAVHLVNARPERDPFAWPEIGPAVDHRQRQGARGRGPRDPRQRDDQAGPRAGALRPARDRALDRLGVVALTGRRQRGIRQGRPQRARSHQPAQREERDRDAGSHPTAAGARDRGRGDQRERDDRMPAERVSQRASIARDEGDAPPGEPHASCSATRARGCLA